MPKYLFNCLCAILSLTFCFGQDSFDPSQTYQQGQIYVQLTSSATGTLNTYERNEISQWMVQKLPILSDYALIKAENTFAFSSNPVLRRTIRLEFAQDNQIDELIRHLNDLRIVEMVERIPNFVAHYVPNDLSSSTGSQWAIHKINAPAAWDITTSSSAMVIGVTENSCQTTHPDLVNKYVSPRDVADNDNDVMPPNSSNSWKHGSHVSGIVGAETDNSEGVASVGFQMMIQPIKVAKNSGSASNYSYALEGLAFAQEQGLKVINCSWGAYTTTTVGDNIVNDAYLNQQHIVASGGNDSYSYVSWPCANSIVTCVGATDEYDLIAGYSNYSAQVDLVGPGEIRSTGNNNSYVNMIGTSMAAPMVSATLGLMYSINQGLTYWEANDCLLNNTVNIDNNNSGYAGNYGSGRLDTYAACDCAAQLANTCPPYLEVTQPVANGGTMLKEAKDSLMSTSIIAPNTTVELDASFNIVLKPGFHAKEGSDVYVTLEGCGGIWGNKREVSEVEKPQEKMNENQLKNYPDPFIDKTTIEFYLDEENEVSLYIYDLKGRLIQKLLDGQTLSSGKYQQQFSRGGLASGMYLYILEIDGVQTTNKMILGK